jgi:hypothetical protein
MMKILMQADALAPEMQTAGGWATGRRRGNPTEKALGGEPRQGLSTRVKLPPGSG